MASPATEVRNYVQDALNRFSQDNGRALGWQDTARYDYPTWTIYLQGDNRFNEASARYAGELGHWVIWLNRNGARVKNPTPKLVDPTPIHRSTPA